ncbi:unnamed protein product [Euphydryas editha]|uniref:Nose resistant-to-fluoxetine protein N-terminal domain-containing protein n=1 Tax=Euphydryas editha TaxID=104508 RepID=A0AAU9UFS7_EUPED|nr:unnamed protein product [Euphydryas editha]
MFLKNFYFISLIVTTTATVHNELGYTSAFDEDLYESVIDNQKCEETLEYMTRNLSVALQFIDASGKIPNGILMGNLADLGNYHQCLDIRYLIDELNIEGKYCMLRVPLNQNLGIALPNSLNIDDYESTLDRKTKENFDNLLRLKYQADLLANRETLTTSRAAGLALTLGVCIPKVCRSKEVFNTLNSLNLTFDEQYCRLPNDKPVSVADYIAIAVFSTILLVTILSTSFTLYQTFILNKDNSEIKKIYSCFSIYTNTKRFLNVNNPPGTIECIDGIRAISMLWVIIGHTYLLTNFVYLTNAIYAITWISSFTSVWVNAAPIAVDTFLTLSGILCVYTVVGKINRCQFIKTLHMFYLNRLLRMFPLLAAVILLQASFIHRVADGPVWTLVASETVQCRMRWWAALLHVQNYIRPFTTCILQTWYLSVDIQLHIVSPIVIVWLFGNTAIAWCSLASAVLISLTLSTTYSFLYNFSAYMFNPTQINGADYMTVYYVNTLTRASPFFIGMVFGYVLHQFKGQKLRLNKGFVAAGWILAFALMAFCIFSIYPVVQADHDAQIFDNFLNAYMRGIWAIALGWLIFTCHHGYGGPINWFLSHQIWKIPARLSYAMYLIHYAIIMIANGTMTTTYYFSDSNTIYRAVSDIMFTFMAAFVLCIFIDAPCSTLQKLLLGKGKPKKETKSESQTNILGSNETGRKINE